MKIWYGHGSEHSMNLVMIGRFKEANDATKATEVIEWLKRQVEEDLQADRPKIGDQADRYSDEMLDLLRRVNVHNIGPAELEQFSYDVTVKAVDTQVIVKTDEIEVSAFLKVLLDKGARVEVFSAHDYPESGTSATNE